jgi:hypothetical protein
VKFEDTVLAFTDAPDYMNIGASSAGNGIRRGRRAGARPLFTTNNRTTHYLLS